MRDRSDVQLLSLLAWKTAWLRRGRQWMRRLAWANKLDWLSCPSGISMSIPASGFNVRAKSKCRFLARTCTPGNEPKIDIALNHIDEVAYPLKGSMPIQLVGFYGTGMETNVACNSEWPFRQSDNRSPIRILDGPLLVYDVGFRSEAGVATSSEIVA